MKIGYESTDKKIEIDIYGIVFEIKNVEKIKEYENIEDDDLDGLEKMIETLIGNGAIKKLNEQRKKDGYGEITSTVALNILIGISQKYMKEYTDNIMRPLENSINRINNYNERARKKYNRRYRRY